MIEFIGESIQKAVLYSDYRLKQMKYFATSGKSDKPKDYDEDYAFMDIAFLVIVNIIFVFKINHESLAFAMHDMIHFSLVFFVLKYFVKCIWSSTSIQDLLHITISDYMLFLGSLIPASIIALIS